MCVSFVFLLASEALFSSNDIVSAAVTDNGQTQLSQVASYDALELIDAGKVDVEAKRFLRRNKDEDDEDSDEDPEDEDRMMRLSVLDDVLAKAAHKTEIDDVLAKALQARSSHELNGLLTPAMLAFARTDREQSLFKQMYERKISLKTFANMMKYNPNSIVGHPFEDVYTSYNRYTLFHNAAKNLA